MLQTSKTSEMGSSDEEQSRRLLLLLSQLRARNQQVIPTQHGKDVQMIPTQRDKDVSSSCATNMDVLSSSQFPSQFRCSSNGENGTIDSQKCSLDKDYNNDSVLSTTPSYVRNSILNSLHLQGHMKESEKSIDSNDEVNGTDLISLLLQRRRAELQGKNCLSLHSEHLSGLSLLSKQSEITDCEVPSSGFDFPSQYVTDIFHHNILSVMPKDTSSFSSDLLQQHIRDVDDSSDRLSIASQNSQSSISNNKSSGGKFQCPLCDFNTAFASNLSGHMRKHTRVELTCDEYESRDTSRFPTVEASYQIGDISKCGSCEYEAKNPTDMKLHMRKHTAVYVFKCEECPFETNRPYLLRNHMRKHNGQMLRCPLCEYETMHQNVLKNHIRIHTGDKFKCDFCEYETIYPSAIAKHKLKHTGDILKCEHCHYSTIYPFDMKNHSRKHTGDMFSCDQCDYQTIYSSAIKKHMHKHTGDMLKCKYCQYETNRTTDLKNHVRKHTGNMLQCEQCQYKTNYPSTLKRHQRKHEEDKNKTLVVLAVQNQV